MPRNKQLANKDPNNPSNHMGDGDNDDAEGDAQLIRVTKDLEIVNGKTWYQMGCDDKKHPTGLSATRILSVHKTLTSCNLIQHDLETYLFPHEEDANTFFQVRKSGISHRWFLHGQPHKGKKTPTKKKPMVYSLAEAVKICHTNVENQKNLTCGAKGKEIPEKLVAFLEEHSNDVSDLNDKVLEALKKTPKEDDDSAPWGKVNIDWYPHNVKRRVLKIMLVAVETPFEWVKNKYLKILLNDSERVENVEEYINDKRFIAVPNGGMRNLLEMTGYHCDEHEHCSLLGCMTKKVRGKRVLLSNGNKRNHTFNAMIPAHGPKDLFFFIQACPEAMLKSTKPKNLMKDGAAKTQKRDEDGEESDDDEESEESEESGEESDGGKKTPPKRNRASPPVLRSSKKPRRRKITKL